MKTLDNVAPGKQVRIERVDGDVRLLTRLSSVGLVPGAVVQVERNDRNRPVLVFERDTRLAINRQECAHIQVEEVA
ncbi:MAG: ferrous iron transport protein A [Atopobiaceae bacterium]|nr:ferrous iron transport protein A [Atopobiaceae bacterium]MBR1828049.1 ferrous iron transport protein A [Atopobiaceae bacterium]